MSKIKVVGFDGRSIQEMQENWKGIELFAFCEAGAGNMVSRAVLLYEDSAGRGKKISEMVLAHFKTRASADTDGLEIKIDETMIRTRLDHYPRIELTPTKLKSWGRVEFELTREVDQALRAAGIKMGQLVEGRCFFKGMVHGDEA